MLKQGTEKIKSGVAGNYSPLLKIFLPGRKDILKICLRTKSTHFYLKHILEKHILINIILNKCSTVIGGVTFHT